MTISLNNIDKSSRLPAFSGGASADVPSQRRILWMAMFTPGLEGRRGLPYCLVGDPGSVKTSTMKQMARRAQLPFYSVLGSLRQPGDYMGVPVPQRRKLSKFDQHLSPDGDAEMLYMHYAPAGFAVQAAAAKNAVLLFDEANTAPPAVQAAMLRVLFEGVVGELELPPGVRMFLAMNRIEDAAGGWDISPAMANRIGWLDWEGSTVPRFTSYLASTGGRGSPSLTVETIDFEEEEAKVDALWDNAWAQTVSLVTGFLTARPELLQQKPKRNAPVHEWPSSRSWELASHALAGSFVYDLSGIERERAVSAFVGQAAYTEFYGWAKNADLPDPADLLDGKVTFKHNPARLDRTAAVLSGCSATVKAEAGAKTRSPRVEALWSFIHDLPESCIDITLPTSVQLVQGGLMVGSTTAYKVLAKLDPVMAVAGPRS